MWGGEVREILAGGRGREVRKILAGGWDVGWGGEGESGGWVGGMVVR